jgi:hypothetical protein
LWPVLALGVLGVSACGIFDTRDAQDPGTDTGGGTTLDSSEKAFVAMTKALTDHKDADYERAISQNFVFSPTLADSLDQNFFGTGVYDNWTKTVEMDVLRLLLSDTQETIVDFGDLTALINKNTFVRYSVTYQLDVITNAAPTDTTSYRGVAQIDVRNENGNWRVTFWDEVETVEGSSTWGFLRGILRLRLNP